MPTYEMGARAHHGGVKDHRRENGLDRGIGWLMTLTVVFFATVITIGTLAAPDTPGNLPFTGTGYSEQLLPDAKMTQPMSTPDADGLMQRGQVTDAMRARSPDPGYLRALEQHQRDIDRMLARPRP